MRLFTLLLLYLAAQHNLAAQINFTNQTHLLTPQKHFSGVAIAVLDMNGDGRDDIARMNLGYLASIAYQQEPNMPFDTRALQALGNESQWGMCAGDLDNNGFPDLLAGGFYDNIKILMADDNGVTYNLVQLTQPTTFTQCVNLADINNDGDLDAFVCHDDGAARIFGNNGAGSLVYQPGWINLATVPPSDNSGNYGSVWSDVDNDNDLDLYIAKCRQGVTSPTDGRRINQLFLNNGNGTYTQDTVNASGLRIGAQSWTADFGDIDNDGDFDCFITNHDVKSQLLLNDGAGHFTDISVAAGIEIIGGLPIQGVFRDFDNDGYVDILVAGSIHYLLRNNGDRSFTLVPDVFDGNQMESFAIGDLNNDGFQDVYGGYANIYTDPSNIPDALWMNTGNDNHFFGMNLRGVQSNQSAVGAKVKLYSPLGIQIREVRAGESYGIMNSMQIHFGMGDQPIVDSIAVFWPSGVIDRLYNLPVNQYVNLQEGGCLTPAIEIQALGATTFCTGDSVALAAPAGYAYSWSTGDTTALIHVFSAGIYRVTVTDPDGCSAISNQIATFTDPVETPSITVAGDTIFCAGGSTVLMASTAQSYLWSNGSAEQSILVTASGQYRVRAQGLCGFFESAPVHVTVLDPDVPQVTPDTTWLLGRALLTAVGDSVLWFDAPGGNLIATGDSLLTPVLDSSTTFWAQNLLVLDEQDVFAGPVNHQGTTQAGNQFNGALIFDCLRPFRLATVKVYAQIAGQRKIDLIQNGAVIQSKTMNIPIGISNLALDFDIPIGADLQLSTDGAVNQANLGTLSPQLRRSDQGVAFPYVIPGVLSIKNSNFGSDRYYYFYNWQLDFYETACYSAPVPVQAVVDSTLLRTSNPDETVAVSIFPNPSSGLVSIAFPAGVDQTGYLRVTDAQGRQVFETDTPAAARYNTFNLNLSGQPAGVYFLEWRGASGKWRGKVMLKN
jgi:hypothetical protein